MNLTGIWMVVSIFTCVGVVAACGVDPELHRRTVARADRESKVSDQLRVRRDHWKKTAARSQALYRDTAAKLKAVHITLAKAKKSLKACSRVVPPRGVIDPRVANLGKGPHRKPTKAEVRKRERATKMAMAQMISHGRLTAKSGRAFLKMFYAKAMKKCGDRHLGAPVRRKRRRRKAKPTKRYRANVTLNITLAGTGRVRRVRVTRSNRKNHPLRRCLIKAVSKIVFPAPKGGRELRFKYTVKLVKLNAPAGLFDD